MIGGALRGQPPNKPAVHVADEQQHRGLQRRQRVHRVVALVERHLQRIGGGLQLGRPYLREQRARTGHVKAAGNSKS
jgi:hypothetical protein